MKQYFDGQFAACDGPSWNSNKPLLHHGYNDNNHADNTDNGTNSDDVYKLSSQTLANAWPCCVKQAL